MWKKIDLLIICICLDYLLQPEERLENGTVVGFSLGHDIEITYIGYASNV